TIERLRLSRRSRVTEGIRPLLVVLELLPVLSANALAGFALEVLANLGPRFVAAVHLHLAHLAAKLLNLTLEHLHFVLQLLHVGFAHLRTHGRVLLLALTA